MGELVNISDKELYTLKNKINARREEMASSHGFANAKKVMLAMFDYLQASGYRLPDTDYEQMAGIYADQLRDHIIVYGYDAIKRAVRDYIKHDNSSYHAMPTAGQLISVIEADNGNPIHELAKREHEKEVAEILERERKEMMAKLTPEEKQRLEEKYERYRKNKTF